MIFILVGASGSGKTSVQHELKKDYEMMRSVTTREPRCPEDHDTYDFVSLEEYAELDLVESVEYAGVKYGMTRGEYNRCSDKDKVFIAVTDINGVPQLRETFGDDQVFTIGLVAEPEDLVTFMRRRGDTDAKVVSRLLHYIKSDEGNHFRQCNVAVRSPDHWLAIPNMTEIVKYIIDCKYERMMCDDMLHARLNDIFGFMPGSDNIVRCHAPTVLAHRVAMEEEAQRPTDIRISADGSTVRYTDRRH